MPLRVYFAAPLFNEGERRYNQYMAERIEARGHSVYLPQRDLTITDRDSLNSDELMNEIFLGHRQEMVDNTDVLTALHDGRVPSEGVAVEMGLAYEMDIPIIGWKTDRRVFSPDEPLNAMNYGASDKYVETEKDLLEAIDEYDEP